MALPHPSGTDVCKCNEAAYLTSFTLVLLPVRVVANSCAALEWKALFASGNVRGTLTTRPSTN
jgi:hypothetical protein